MANQLMAEQIPFPDRIRGAVGTPIWAQRTTNGRGRCAISIAIIGAARRILALSTRPPLCDPCATRCVHEFPRTRPKHHG